MYMVNVQGINSFFAVIMDVDEPSEHNCDVLNLNNRNGDTAPLTITDHRIITPLLDRPVTLPNRCVVFQEWKMRMAHKAYIYASIVFIR